MKKQKPINEVIEKDPTMNKTYKDSLFRFIFGNEQHKEWALSLFNAVNHTSYDDPDQLVFGQSDDVFYMNVREDVTFFLPDILALFEHQSTYSPNLPLRMLVYVAKLLNAYVSAESQYVYRARKIDLPKIKCVVLYNGTDTRFGAETTLKLSDLISSRTPEETLGNGFDVEVIVHVLNINPGYNEGIQKGSKPLEEYSWMVNRIRSLIDTGCSLKEAVNTAINELPKEFLIHDEIMRNVSGVITQMLTELEDKRMMELRDNEMREEGIIIGEERGLAKGKAEGIVIGEERGIAKEKVAFIRMLIVKNMPDDFIMEVARITKEQLEEIKQNIPSQD